MAAVDVEKQVPSHLRCVPGSVNIPVAQFPATKPHEAQIDPAKIAADVVSTFNEALEKSEYAILSHLFLENGFWRDHLAVTWAFRTIHKPADILDFVQKSAKSKDGFRLKKITIDDSSTLHAPQLANLDVSGHSEGIRFFIKLDTAVGTGNGLVSLVEDNGEWKIFNLYTRLDEIKGHEEAINERRPHGVRHGGRPGRKNWKERRQAEYDFENNEPAVVVIGELHYTDTK